MSRRRRKNPLLGRIITGTIIAHIVILPIAAHFGAFDKIKKQFSESRVTLAPAPKQIKDKDQAKEHKTKPKPTKTAGKPTARRGGPLKADPNRQKVVADSSSNPGASSDGPGIVQGTKTDAGAVPPPTAGAGSPKPNAGGGGAVETVPPVKPPVTSPTQPTPPITPKPEEAPKPKHVPVYVEPAQDFSPQPTIPDDLRNEPLEKNFVALFTVGPDGKPTDVKMTQSTGSAELDEIALKTARQWRFKPATLDGSGVQSKVKLTIEFKVE